MVFPDHTHLLSDDLNTEIQKKVRYVTRHAKRYELGGRRHFEKMRLKVNVASRKNSTPTRVSKRSLAYCKTGSKAFFMLRFSAARLSNFLYDIKCPF